MPRRSRMNSCSNPAPPPMKVVYIKTQYVETDALSFKSVVQNLTGKDSTAGALPPAAENVVRREKFSISRDCLGGGGAGIGNHSSLLTRDLSAKELEQLLKELPPFDELHKLLSFEF